MYEREAILKVSPAHAVGFGGQRSTFAGEALALLL